MVQTIQKLGVCIWQSGVCLWHCTLICLMRYRWVYIILQYGSTSDDVVTYIVAIAGEVLGIDHNTSDNALGGDLMIT